MMLSMHMTVERQHFLQGDYLGNVLSPRWAANCNKSPFLSRILL